MAATTYPQAPTPWGNRTYLNITAATVVKTGSGVPVTCAVVVAGSTAGAIYDASSTSGNTSANQVFVAPNTVGNYPVSFPCITGIVVTPGTGQTIALSFD